MIYTLLKLNKNTLIAENLEVGNYNLEIKSLNKIIQIKVHKAKRWNNTNLLIGKNYLLNLTKALPYIVVDNLEFQEKR